MNTNEKLQTFLEMLHDCGMPRSELAIESVEEWWSAEHQCVVDRLARLEADSKPRSMEEHPPYDEVVYVLVPATYELGVWGYAPEEPGPLVLDCCDGWIPIVRGSAK